MKSEKQESPASFDIRPPNGLQVTVLDVGGEDFAIFSYPLPTVQVPSCLSAAESAIAGALLKGHSYKRIASSRRTSVRTVANQVRSIFKKCNVKSRIELAARQGVNHV